MLGLGCGLYRIINSLSKAIGNRGLPSWKKLSSQTSLPPAPGI